MHGADFLCYVAPSEHLVMLRRKRGECRRTRGHVQKQAMQRISYRVDLETWEWDEKMSTETRKNRKWAEQIRLAVHPDLAHQGYPSPYLWGRCDFVMCA